MKFLYKFHNCIKISDHKKNMVRNGENERRDAREGATHNR
jgi:hypothetical protein